MVMRSTAKKTAAPVKGTRSSVSVPTPAAKPVAVEKVTAHDVLRAGVALRTAQAEYDRLEAVYWSQNENELAAAVEHAEKATADATPLVRAGRKPADTPSAKARAKTPVIDEFYDKEKTTAMGLRDLRELAAELAEKNLITELKMKKTIIEQMEAAGLFREEGLADSDEDDALDDDEDVSEDEEDEEEYEDEDDESEDDDESDESDDDDDEEDEDGLTLDDLKGMKLKELQDLAEQNSVDSDGLTKSELIEALWEAANDEEEEDEEDSSDDDIEDDEEDEEEEGEDEEETVEIDLADLPKYSVDELLDIAKQIEGLKIPVSKRKDKKFLIQKVTEALTEDDE